MMTQRRNGVARVGGAHGNYYYTSRSRSEHLDPRKCDTVVTFIAHSNYYYTSRSHFGAPNR